MDPPNLSAFSVSSVDGFLCLCNYELETYKWNQAIRKSKKIHDSPLRSSSNTKLGFGYDESHDDFKVLFINYSSPSYYDSMGYVSNPNIMVYIYSLRTDSWTIVHDQLQGNFLKNTLGKYINGRIKWISCNRLGIDKIIYFYIADETWGTLGLPFLDNKIVNISSESWEMIFRWLIQVILRILHRMSGFSWIVDFERNCSPSNIIQICRNLWMLHSFMHYLYDFMSQITETFYFCFPHWSWDFMAQPDE